MQRNIKFRVRNISAKTWIKELLMDMNGRLVHFDGTTRYYIEGPNYIKVQFTGLHDKNGKEIWEGDVVYCDDCFFSFKNGIVKNGEGYISRHKGTFNGWFVEYIPPSSYIVHRGMTNTKVPLLDKSFEVLGNIYENPKLLERSESDEQKDC